MGKKRLRLKGRLSKIKNDRYASLRCPQCNSNDITYYMGAQFGKYQCKNCGYVGVIVIEENEASDKKGRKRKYE